MTVTVTFLLISPNNFFDTQYRIDQQAKAIKIRNRGSKPVKNTLKMAVEGVNPLISESLKKQSIDKKASLDAPTF